MGRHIDTRLTFKYIIKITHIWKDLNLTSVSVLLSSDKGERYGRTIKFPRCYVYIETGI